MDFLPRHYLFFFITLLLLMPRTNGQETEKVATSIQSEILNESIELIMFDTAVNKEDKPLIYFTDEGKMIRNGALGIIRKLDASEKIPKAKYIFVSTISRDTKEDKRNDYFFCNPDYVSFFEDELIPLVEGDARIKIESIQRSLVGISFGGINGAYFSGSTELFQNYALLSPITYPCGKVISNIVFSETMGLRVIRTSGMNDAEEFVRPLSNIYTSKGYTVKTLFTKGSHDFENWNSQLEVVLNFLTKSSANIH